MGDLSDLPPQFSGHQRRWHRSVDKTNNKVLVKPSHLVGCTTDATDLRAGAALVVASLGAEGISTVNNIGYILRGYEDMVGKLASVGADIKVI